MKRFVVGDIHGAHKALLQCFEKSKFDPDRDLLISLGDICDGWPDVSKVFDTFLGLKHFKLIASNHDAWALRWMKNGWKGPEWVNQGGSATMAAYQKNWKAVPKPHLDLLLQAPPYLELDNKLFVHGGVDPDTELQAQDPEDFLWDRKMFQDAVSLSQTQPEHRFGKWEDIFIGHTPTHHHGTYEPIHACNVWGLDTGAGWSGPLTLMDIDTHEYWQSDLVPTIYPESSGRR